MHSYKWLSKQCVKINEEERKVCDKGNMEPLNTRSAASRRAGSGSAGDRAAHRRMKWPRRPAAGPAAAAKATVAAPAHSVLVFEAVTSSGLSSEGTP